MNEVFEYRRAPSKGVIWLAVGLVVVLMTALALTGTRELVVLVCVFGLVAICWMVLPRSVAGIQVDDDFLVLSAWQNPKKIALDDIAYMRALHDNVETEVEIVYKDGSIENTLAGDMPALEILAVIMAARGVPLRGIY